MSHTVILNWETFSLANLPIDSTRQINYFLAVIYQRFNVLWTSRQKIHFFKNLLDIFHKSLGVKHELDEYGDYPIEYYHHERYVQQFQRNHEYPPNSWIHFERNPGHEECVRWLNWFDSCIFSKKDLPNIVHEEPRIDCVFSNEPLIKHPDVRTEEKSNCGYHLSSPI